MQFAFIVAVVVIAIAAAVIQQRAAAARRLASAALAQRLGLVFAPAPDEGHDEDYAHFEIFRRGRSRVAENTLSGHMTIAGQRCRVKMGDFRYKQDHGAGKNRRTVTRRFSYLIVHLPYRTPAVLVRPEGMFDKVAAAFGFDDIDFESAEFSRRFFVKSSDKRFAYALLEPRMMEFLLAARPPMLDLEDGQLCLSDGQRRWDPAQFQAMMDLARRFLEAWPRHLVAQLQERTWTTPS